MDRRARLSLKSGRKIMGPGSLTGSFWPISPAPMMSMAAVTTHLGFGVTVNVNHEHPYTFAWRISTLDHLTGGRIGWNVVTGYLDSAARAVGRAAQDEHDQRYDLAHDYLEALYKLWEGSWEDGAVVKGRASRLYADSAKVHKIHHDGPFFQFEGYHLPELLPQRSAVIYQAGSSGRGQHFAAHHAECVFISAPDKAVARAQSDGLRRAVVAAGRRAGDVKILTGINIVTDRNPAVALEKLAEVRAASSPEAGLAHYSASTGIDFARFGLDDPVPYAGSNAIQSAMRLAESSGCNRAVFARRNMPGGTLRPL